MIQIANLSNSCKDCRQAIGSVYSGKWPPPAPITKVGENVYRCKLCGHDWLLSPPQADPIAGKAASQPPVSNYIFALVPLLLIVVNLLAYIITAYTDQLLKLPLFYSGGLACITVVLLSLFINLIKRRSKLCFGIIWIVIGLSSAIWTVVSVQRGPEYMKGAGLWIGLLVTLGIVMDGLDNMRHKKAN